MLGETRRVRPENPVMLLSQRSRRRLVFSLLVLAGLVVFGTVCFQFIEGWSLGDSLYMTMMTVTTVGYGPPLPLSTAGRNFTIFFMIIGVGATGYILSSAVQALVQSEILSVYSERRRKREMDKLQNHYIICGAGRIGLRIIRELQRERRPFVVIERDPQKAAQLDIPDQFLLVRDATLDETLHCAGVERATALAACLADDADNLYVVLTAHTLNPRLNIVARAVEESARSKLHKAGATSIVPLTSIGSHRMAQALLKPRVAEYMDRIGGEDSDLVFEEITIHQHSKLAGSELRSTRISSDLGVVVVAIHRGKTDRMVFNPSGDTRLESGDMLIAIGPLESLAELKLRASGGK